MERFLRESEQTGASELIDRLRPGGRLCEL